MYSIDMSTRTNIKIVGGIGSILLYKHHDGYPSNMIPFLTKWMKESKYSVEHVVMEMITNTECRPAACLHGDIEYYYEMDLEAQEIRSFKVSSDENFENQRMERIFPEVVA